MSTVLSALLESVVHRADSRMGQNREFSREIRCWAQKDTIWIARAEGKLNEERLEHTPLDKSLTRRKEARMGKSSQHPEKQGKLDIYPQIVDGRFVEVVIVGTPEGLRCLARLLERVAAADQDDSAAPPGSREHLHLHPATHLGDHSCEVEICRADAKTTGDLPRFMQKPKK